MLNYILGIIEKNGNIKECGNIDVGFSNGSLKIVKKFIYDHIDLLGSSFGFYFLIIGISSHRQFSLFLNDFNF